MKFEQSKEVAVVITEPGQNVALLSKEILKSLGVKEVQVTNTPHETADLVAEGSVSLILVDDIQERPAPLVLRQLLCHALAPITPTIVLLSDQCKYEAGAISTLGRPMILHKPLTPGRLASGYKALKNVWSKGDFAEIQRAAKLLAVGQRETGMQILTELARNPKIHPVIAPTISVMLRQSNNLQVAEKILLAALKTAPRDLGLILSLSDLYMHAAMPFTSLRLMKGIEASFGDTMTAYLDKAQAYLMLGDLESSILVLHAMLQKHLYEEETRDYLLRLLFSQGNVEEFLKHVKSDAKAHHFSNLWGKSVPHAPINNAS